MKRILGTVIALALGAPVFAMANEAYIVGDISLQSGPDSEYPPIVDLQAGMPVDVQGCIEGFSWCDVIAGNDRGWVPGSYVEEEYDNQPVYLVDYGPRIGVPIVSFSIGTYWDTHYHNRPFYAQRNVWVERHFQPRPPPRPSFAHAPPIPNRGGHGPDNHGPDNRGHAGAVNNASQPQHTMTNNNAAAHRTAPVPKPEQRDERAAANNGNQHAPVATTHTQTVKRTTTTTERAETTAPQHPQATAQPRQQTERMPPKPQQTTPRAQPKEQPKPAEHKDDDHGH